MRDMAPKPVFPFTLETHLVDHCILNCSGCSHFAPLVPGEVYADVDVYERDLHRMRELFHDIYQISLMGGEPLLHPEINSFIDITRQAFPQSKIAIFTNGMLLKSMPESFWQMCNASRARIKITQYPIALDFKSIKQFVKSKQVQIKIPKEVNTFYQFINLRGDSDPQKSFRTCRAMYTAPFLSDGKIYPCSFAPHVHYFSEYFNQTISASSKDYIDIRASTTPEDILTFLKQPIPLCRWCKERRTPIPWHISKKAIEEWTQGDSNHFSHAIYIGRKYAISKYHHTLRNLAMKWRSGGNHA
jgi:MoaA/NifB/PqqE/SkfB family radical SAM enzyme